MLYCYRIAQIWKLFLKWISNFSFCWWQFPSCIKIFVLDFFEFLFELENGSIAFLYFSHELAIVYTIRFEKFLYFFDKVPWAIFRYGDLQSLKFLLILINFSFIHVNDSIGLDEFGLSQRIRTSNSLLSAVVDFI